MMLTIWAISLYLEAVLATITGAQGGFRAFRLFLWYDVITQVIEILLAGSAAWYPIAHRWAEVGGVVMLMFVVAEARTCKQSLQVARVLAITAAACIPAHLILARSVSWSMWASAVWQGVALSHSIMGVFLFAGMAVSRQWSRNALLLALWLLADAGLFYVAPLYPVGLAVLWLNAGTWGAWIIFAVTVRTFPAKRTI